MTASWRSTDAVIVCRQLLGSGSGQFELVTVCLLRIENVSFISPKYHIRALMASVVKAMGYGGFSVTCTETENTDLMSNQTMCSHSRDGDATCAGI